MAKKERKFGRGRTENAYKNRGGGGKNFSALDFNSYDGNVPRFKMEEGTHKWNIVPFELTNSKAPVVVDGVLDVGELDYFMALFQHKGLGAAGDTTVVCPARSFIKGKACPICEEYNRLKDAGEEKAAEGLKPKQRVFLNVQPIIKGKPGELHHFEVSHFLFMKELLEEAGECGDGKDIVEFAHPTKGKVVKFRATEETKGKAKWHEFKSFDFLEREEELDDDLIDEAVPFDKLFKVLPYAELEAILHGQESEDAEEEEETTSPAEEDYKDEKSKSSEDHEDFDEGMEKKKAEAKAKRKAEKEAEKAKESESGTCPQGKVFGKDYSFDPKLCRKCPLEDECLDAS